MNAFDDQTVDYKSFAYENLTGTDSWSPFTVTYSFATATSLTVVGRYKILGRMCFWQVQSSGTSLATTAGTSYITLPVTAKGYGGVGQMSNVTAKTSVGAGHVSVADNRFYPPAQAASANTFVFAGWHEI